MSKHFGCHLILDGYNGDAEKLNSKELVEKFQKEVIKACNMTILLGPHCVEAGALSEKDRGGKTGFTVIAESHVAIHTFPFNDGFASIDIYTCQNEIDHEKIINITQHFFNFKTLDPTVLKRGLRFGSK